MKDGSPDVLGATVTDEGVNFAVRSRAATRVDVCLYDATGEKETARLTLPRKTGNVFHGLVEPELARAGALSTRLGLRPSGSAGSKPSTAGFQVTSPTMSRAQGSINSLLALKR